MQPAICKTNALPHGPMAWGRAVPAGVPVSPRTTSNSWTHHEPAHEPTALDCGDMSPLWLHDATCRTGLVLPPCSQSGGAPPQSKTLTRSSWSRCAIPKSWTLPMNRPFCREVLDCASPLALFEVMVGPKAAEHRRSPRRWRVVPGPDARFRNRGGFPRSLKGWATCQRAEPPPGHEYQLKEDGARFVPFSSC